MMGVGAIMILMQVKLLILYMINEKKNPGDFDVRSVRSGQFHYMVDFRQMTQTNVDHDNHTTRKIKRTTLN